MMMVVRRWGPFLAVLAAVVALGSHPAGAGASAIAGAPGGANGADGAIDAISCASAGNCTAVGHLAPPSRKVLFTVSEKDGVWAAARAVPGLAALLGGKPSGARFSGVSCPSAGNCGAVGSYSPRAGLTRGFVLSEKNGTWGQPRRVSGLVALAGSHVASVDSVDCPSAGNCSAGGTYAPSRNHSESRAAFLVGEKHGVWGKARSIAGLARLNTGGGDGRPDAGFSQISCSSAGNCLAAGSYVGKKGTEPFTVTEQHGTWGPARAFPRIIAANEGAFAGITSVSCLVARNCTATGFYFQSETDGGVFVFSQKNGVWGPLKGVAGTLLSTALFSLTCVSTSNCTAGGDDTSDPSDTGPTQPYVAAEKHGAWTAQRLPGVADLSAQTMNASLSRVICRSAGNCSAVGTYATSSGAAVFVSTEQDGTWGTAADLPGLAALNHGNNAGFPVMSCGAPGDCSLGGFYQAGHLSKPYLASQQNGTWGQAHEVAGIEP
jgi:hypothetical protein